MYHRHVTAGIAETAADGTISKSSLHDEDDMENRLSAAAMEIELKPKVIESFDRRQCLQAAASPSRRDVDREILS
jgi:hypothetical protein